jgi:DNA ligase (NAD+)
VVAQKMVEHFGSLDALQSATVEDFAGITGIGPILAGNVVEWFAHPHNRQVVDKLRAAGVRVVEERREDDGGPRPLDGLTFVITGTLPTYGREQAAEMIRQAGGKVTGAVSAKTSYLLAGEAGGGKLDKARKLGVRVIDEAALLTLLAGGTLEPEPDSA